MALEGQLSDFNLAEILQLIASQQKSGFLHLEARRDMVFIFEKGYLISTRDRRNKSRDPLDAYLKAYGFFTDEQWKHIDYVARNSTLDLTEILISESLITEEELTRALTGLAQEMVHAGMKLRRGRYHFNATKDSPPGVRGRYRLDVQGLLMEAARRLDEETQLAELLPSQAMTFCKGDSVIPVEALAPHQRRIMELAMAGVPLGRIIRQGRTESFAVRNLLKNWCDEKFLQIKQAGSGNDGDDDGQKSKRTLSLGPGLRAAPRLVALVLLLGVVGWLRWYMPTPVSNPAALEIRQSQLRSEVIQAATMFRYENGNWPDTLGALVRAGHLAPGTLATVEDLGWKYALHEKQDRYSLTS